MNWLRRAAASLTEKVVAKPEKAAVLARVAVLVATLLVLLAVAVMVRVGLLQ